MLKAGKEAGDCPFGKQPFPELDSSNVHTNCCDGHRVPDHPAQRPDDLYFAEQFTMDWDFWYIDDCIYPKCDLTPPYDGGVPPFEKQRKSSGTTFSDHHYRGGAQKEYYYDECIPVFPGTSGNFKWPCEFINIIDEGRGYLISHEGRAPYWPECCVMGEPFKPPMPNFTEHMNYGGVKQLDGKDYHEVNLDIPPSGGPFYYNFWDGRQEFQSKGYHVPSTFNMLGIDAGYDKIWMSQIFRNHQTGAPSEDVWAIPDSCYAKDVQWCMMIQPPKETIE